MNSGYGDVRYKVHIWGFSCLDYSFDVLISQIGNLALYNWFCHIYFTYYLLACSCMFVLTTRFLIHAFDSELFAHVCFFMHATGTHLTTRWRVSDSPKFVCPDLETWTVMDFLLIRIAQWLCRGSAVDQPGLYPFRSPARLSSFSFVTRERLLYCF